MYNYIDNRIAVLRKSRFCKIQYNALSLMVDFLIAELFGRIDAAGATVLGRPHMQLIELGQRIEKTINWYIAKNGDKMWLLAHHFIASSPI